MSFGKYYIKKVGNIIEVIVKKQKHFVYLIFYFSYAAFTPNVI